MDDNKKRRWVARMVVGAIAIATCALVAPHLPGILHVVGNVGGATLTALFYAACVGFGFVLGAYLIGHVFK